MSLALAGGMTRIEPAVGDDQTFAIIGAAMEVHRILGPGLFEGAYCDAFGHELGLRKVPFTTEQPCPVIYKGHRLRGHYRIDFVCFDRVVVEIKARATVGPAEHAQILNYLAASGRRLGLLFNFGTPRLDYRRFVMDAAATRRARADTDDTEGRR